MNATASTDRRELAHRISDGIDVTLFWTKHTNRVSLTVHDSHCDETFAFDVDGADALDAFNHPYAYAGARRSRVAAAGRVASSGLTVGADE